jgi:hypothetical protein
VMMLGCPSARAAHGSIGSRSMSTDGSRPSRRTRQSEPPPLPSPSGWSASLLPLLSTQFHSLLSVLIFLVADRSELKSLWLCVYVLTGVLV